MAGRDPTPTELRRLRQKVVSSKYTRTEKVDFTDFANSLKEQRVPQLINSLRDAHIALSISELAKEQRRGNLLNPAIFVDNLPGKKITNVKFAGKIRFSDKTTLDTLKGLKESPAKMIMQWLVQASPRLNLEYQLSHTLFYNGTQAFANNPNLTLEQPTDTLIFVNRMPYAKRLEGVRYRAAPSMNRNKTFARTRAPTGKANLTGRQQAENARQNKIAGRPKDVTADSAKYMSAQAPNGIYNVIAKKINRTYRGRLKAQFTYFTMNQFTGTSYGGPERTGAMGGDRGRIRAFYAESGKAQVFPALVVTLDSDRGHNINVT